MTIQQLIRAVEKGDGTGLYYHSQLISLPLMACTRSLMKGRHPINKIYRSQLTLGHLRTQVSCRCMQRGAAPWRRKEMFYLTTHSTHFIYDLYGIRRMVKDHSDSQKGNPLPPHMLLFLINSNGSFICTILQTGQHIPLPLLHQLWITGWNKKKLNGSTP